MVVKPLKQPSQVQAFFFLIRTPSKTKKHLICWRTLKVHFLYIWWKFTKLIYIYICWGGISNSISEIFRNLDVWIIHTLRCFGSHAGVIYLCCHENMDNRNKAKDSSLPSHQTHTHRAASIIRGAAPASPLQEA